MYLDNILDYLIWDKHLFLTACKPLILLGFFKPYNYTPTKSPLKSMISEGFSLFIAAQNVGKISCIRCFLVIYDMWSYNKSTDDLIRK